MAPRNKQRLPVLDFGVGEWQVVAQSEIQGQPLRDFVRILHIAIQRVATNAARKVAAALQEEDRLPKQETRERIGDWKRNKDEEAVGGDALQHIHLKMLI